MVRSLVLGATFLAPLSGLAQPALADVPVQLSLEPDEGHAGDRVTARATGIPPRCSSFSFFWESAPGEPTDPDGNGEASTTLTVPDDAAPGPLTLHTRCGDGELSEDGPTKTFTVLQRPRSPRRRWPCRRGAGRRTARCG